MSAFASLEKSLDELFVKNGPALPVGFKKWLVKYLPWRTVVSGVLTLLATLSLWNAGHRVNELVDYANQISQTYGGGTVTAAKLGAGYWLALVTLGIEAILYIAAFPALRQHKKSGWDLMFYALLVNLVYGFFAIFTTYAGVGNFIGSIIGAAIGGYFLFQIRASYTGSKTSAPAKKA